MHICGLLEVILQGSGSAPPVPPCTKAEVAVLLLGCCPPTASSTSPDVLALIQGQDGWGVTYTSTEICALKGSTVEISCTYRYPSRINERDTKVEETIWFVRLQDEEPVDVRTDSEYSGRVEYHCDKNDCTLRIRDVRESDSAEYKFMFITNQPGLNVVVVGRMLHSHEDLSKDSQYAGRVQVLETERGRSTLRIRDLRERDSAQYHFTFKTPSFEWRSSLPATTLTVTDPPKLPSVSVSPSAEIVEGSSVTLTCSSDANPAAKYTWYKENEDSPKASGQIFTITDFRAEHSGNYYSCEAQNRIGCRNSTTLLPVLCQEQDDVNYTSVSFCKKQEDPLYSNIRPAQANRLKNEEEDEDEEGVQYAMVNIKSASASSELRRPEAVEDSSALYSTVTKKPRTRQRKGLCKDATSFFTPRRETRGAAMSLRAAASGLVVFLLSVSVIQGQDGWGVTYTSTEICALKGSTVEISCTYRYPSRINERDTKVEETIWFVRLQDEEPVDVRTDSEYSGRVEYHCDKNDCTLRIRDVRESGSAEYKFMFITNQPGWEIYWITWSHFVCHSRCRLPDQTSYIWYKNGQKMWGKTSSSYSDYIYHADSFSCAAQGYEDFPSPSACDHDNFCNRVTYTDRSICAFKGSSVDISCTYNSDENNVESKFWFSPDCSRRWQNPSQPEDLSKDSQYAGRVQVLETERGRSTLRIRDLRERDSAQYHFTFKTPSFEWRSSLPATTLTVTALQVQVSRVTVHQFYTEAELKCHSSCSPAGRLSYVWVKNGEKLRWDEKSTYKGRFNPGDNISCALKGHEDFPSPSVYAPKLPSVSVSPSAEIVEGSSVTLTCSSDANPAANYTWYKENEDSPKASGQIFTITDFRAEHSGNYYCEAQNRIGRHNATLHLIVLPEYLGTTDQEKESEQILDTLDLFMSSWSERACRPQRRKVRCAKERVKSDHCGRSQFRKKKTLSSTTEPNEAIETIEREKFFPIKINQHFGNIYSKINNARVHNLKCPERSRRWQNASQPEDLSKDSQYAGRVQVLETERGRSTLRISDLRERDSAQYHFTFKTPSFEWRSSLPATTLTVTALQVQVSRVTVHQFYTEAELKCHSSCSPAGRLSYVWVKNGKTEEKSTYKGRFYPGDNISCALKGHEDFPSPSVYAPKLPSVSVSPSAEIVEGSSVTLTCSSDANPAAKYTWYKENGNITSPSKEPQLVFRSIQSSDSGEYYCTAENELGTRTSGNISINVKF
ncbi:hypothetical protein L3Q82_005510 [Scortum barcoo]|uniref:Uncharacterized protein n=1 Tax=Scortum barcoo TaxID=214431 RepID=A0ACB8VAN7_9TELE|nr:hypothetical protein L3Q82_005510 [Scortum barcoo]